MQNNLRKLVDFDMHKGSVIRILGDSDVFLVESFEHVDSSDQIVLRSIGLNGSTSEQTIHKSDIILASSEVVTKSFFFQERNVCPLCASPVSDSRRLFTVKQLFWDINVMHCLHCGMTYKAPLASPNLLGYIYTQNYVHHTSKGTKKETNALYRSKVKRLGLVRGRHLDYGCGAGGFVEASLNAGWDSYGADPYLSILSSDSPVAARLFKIDATDPDLLTIIGKFDCISIWAAVEHLIQFKDTISGLVRILNPGGTIVFNSPNAHSLIAKYAGNLWRMATLIEHVQFCTPQAAKYMASVNGLTVQKLRICGSPYPLGKASGLLDQGLVALPFLPLIKSEVNSVDHNSTLLPCVPMRKSIMSVIQKYLLGSSGGMVAALVRQAIHTFQLGDHIEVTMKLK